MNGTGGKTTARKVLVIGLDGATPEFVFPWAEQGLLPNLAQLISRGAWGPVDSTMPPFTAMAWPVFFTGCNPGKTGIFSYYENLQAKNRRPATGQSLRAKPIWRILNAHGKRSIVVAVPMTYPPEPLSGVMISGMDTPAESSQYTFPPQLRNELEKLNYKIFPDNTLGYKGEPQALFKDALGISRVKTQVFTRLLRDEPWDFAMIVLNELDVISHFVNDNLILRFYQEMDKLVGEMLQAVEDDTLVLVISDHGVKPLKGRIYINEILKDLGLLKLKEDKSTAQLLSRVGITRDRVRQLLYRFGIAKLLRQRTPGAWSAVRSNLKANAHKELADVDMERTKLYLDSGFWLHENPAMPITDSELQRLREALRPYNCELHRGRDLYSGPYTKDAPDFIIYSPDYLNAKAVGTGKWVGPTENRTGDHSFHATAILAGDKNLVQSGPIKGRLIDWTPTLLYLMGVPIPTEIDGEIIAEVIQPSVLANRSIATQEVSAREVLRERIRMLKVAGRI